MAVELSRRITERPPALKRPSLTCWVVKWQLTLNGLCYILFFTEYQSQECVKSWRWGKNTSLFYTLFCECFPRHNFLASAIILKLLFFKLWDVPLFFRLIACSSFFQTHRMFLHSLYQRMITGQVYVSSPDSALSKYSWTDMCNLVSEQVSAHLSELNRATERV